MRRSGSPWTGAGIVLAKEAADLKDRLLRPSLVGVAKKAD